MESALNNIKVKTIDGFAFIDPQSIIWLKADCKNTLIYIINEEKEIHIIIHIMSFAYQSHVYEKLISLLLRQEKAYLFFVVFQKMISGNA